MTLKAKPLLEYFIVYFIICYCYYSKANRDFEIFKEAGVFVTLKSVIHKLPGHDLDSSTEQQKKLTFPWRLHSHDSYQIVLAFKVTFK